MELPAALICPACGKANPTADDPEECIRCRCELSPLLNILKLAMHHRRKAMISLTRYDYRSALRHVEDSWRLLHNESVAQLGFLASIGDRNPSAIARWQKALENASAESDR